MAKKVITAESVARGMIVSEAVRRIGVKQGSQIHKHIIDDFNRVKPDGGAMTYTAPWCAAFASAMAIRVFGVHDAKEYFPLSYNCNTIILKAKRMNIWKERDSYKPEPGDWILYDWDDSGSTDNDNKGSADHVGIVRYVTGDSIHVVEGNKGTTSQVGERIMHTNGRFIRGFVCPKYEVVTIQGRAIKAAEKLEKRAIEDKMTYNGSATYNTYKQALKGKKQLNCATAISYILQAVKVLPVNRRIWLSDKINGSGAATIKKRASVTYPNKRPGKMLNTLKPGDICGWKKGDLVHTAMVHHIVGKRIYWVTFGKSDMARHNMIRRRPFYYGLRVKVLIKLHRPE